MLTAASSLFRARGYEGIGIAELLEKSGAPRGSLYFHFPGGKEQMANEVLAAIDLWFNEKIYAPLRAASDPGKGIAEMYVATGDARGYGLRPGYRGLYAGGRVSVGPLGLRGQARPGGVLLLGDSAGFGQGLDDDQTIAARLQALLAAKADGAAPPPVTNAGVPGYNTTTQLAQLKVLLPQLRPRQVVLLYVVDNDTDLRPGVWVKEDGSLDLHLPTGLLSRVSRQLTRHLVTYAELRGLVQIRQAQLVQAQDELLVAKRLDDAMLIDEIGRAHV